MVQTQQQWQRVSRTKYLGAHSGRDVSGIIDAPAMRSTSPSNAESSSPTSARRGPDWKRVSVTKQLGPFAGRGPSGVSSAYDAAAAWGLSPRGGDSERRREEWKRVERTKALGAHCGKDISGICTGPSISTNTPRSRDGSNSPRSGSPRGPDWRRLSVQKNAYVGSAPSGLLSGPIGDAPPVGVSFRTDEKKNRGQDWRRLSKTKSLGGLAGRDVSTISTGYSVGSDQSPPSSPTSTTRRIQEWKRVSVTKALGPFAGRAVSGL
eukprot:TRINITY_DN19219_c0_g1_i1.p1 TRINITY_DN19219_c0_g1~~TRINITY_DN19219_c0_g1_i1.p1  ORF type:complete len:264 (-),score=32.50 TRINITY_DN19219_c0_g1_i1:84-875(-)